ncbi:hypothetical protein TSOC_012726 [Tetrabaena socialis]|uniref:Uncharacterized protein n=1 Tax=Tetrabaena socialis TaxID=47790 RepID=A0A2J7ZMA0_9CHLO|nr:hypothetical protein TSOC_012726 [Tetrabaena socialis]|eukprot:PNH01394.1 hypothetical protein TSOC_012726 [Tetrabaena socialis]
MAQFMEARWRCSFGLATKCMLASVLPWAVASAEMTSAPDSCWRAALAASLSQAQTAERRSEQQQQELQQRQREQQLALLQQELPLRPEGLAHLVSAVPRLLVRNKGGRRTKPLHARWLGLATDAMRAERAAAAVATGWAPVGAAVPGALDADDAAGVSEACLAEAVPYIADAAAAVVATVEGPAVVMGPPAATVPVGATCCHFLLALAAQEPGRGRAEAAGPSGGARRGCEGGGRVCALRR